ncbi:Hpt domain-containing protein [Carboxylicivirga linearis]|uniref:Hpt domain-containing protein n=1 Tax=Carboxylicivirga linearis TaxID=1628157 RepID=A0ABS5JPK3_9BACT|nr:Hpt domain-containing protein [Carboxylicivirga linearis]MBS2096817.1 Hpt domain-containing protein [Carboxylicivirga linearis]
MIDKIKHIFIEETNNDLMQLKKELQLVEPVKPTGEAVEKIFRAMHTIKGSAPMFGFTQLTEIAMPVESVYRDLYNGKIVLNSTIIDKTKDVVSLIQEVLNKKDECLPSVEEKKKTLIDFFTNIDRLNVRTND